MKRFAIVLGALALAAPLSAQATTIVNGSFEQTATPVPAGGFETVSGGDSTSITGWMVTGNSVDVVGTYWQAASGQNSIDLDGNGQGGIQQTLTDLVIGRKYTITFSLAGNPDAGNFTKEADVAVGLDAATNYYFNDATASRADMGWEQHYLTFTASATSAVLSFASATPGSFGPALDAVSISSVPEASTWAMMLLGFAGLGLAGRRSIRRASV